MADKKKIIIDTDCGSDDAMAIAMALNDPNLALPLWEEFHSASVY